MNINIDEPIFCIFKLKTFSKPVLLFNRAVLLCTSLNWLTTLASSNLIPLPMVLIGILLI